MKDTTFLKCHIPKFFVFSPVIPWKYHGMHSSDKRPWEFLVGQMTKHGLRYSNMTIDAVFFLILICLPHSVLQLPSDQLLHVVNLLLLDHGPHFWVFQCGEIMYDKGKKNSISIFWSGLTKMTQHEEIDEVNMKLLHDSVVLDLGTYLYLLDSRHYFLLNPSVLCKNWTWYN